MEASLPQLILPIKLEKSVGAPDESGRVGGGGGVGAGAGVVGAGGRRLAGPKSGRGYRPHAVCAGADVDVARGRAAAGGRAGVAGRAGGAGERWG